MTTAFNTVRLFATRPSAYGSIALHSRCTALPSSSGQDAGLSRRKQGFDSPRERHSCGERNDDLVRADSVAAAFLCLIKGLV